MPRPPKSRNDEPGTRNEGGGGAAMRGGDIGVHLFVCVGLGAGLGYLLDRWMGWGAWGLTVGCFLGFGAWLRAVWKVMKQA